MVSEELSNGSLGWTIRKIAKVTPYSVILNDGVSFASDCFSGAKEGDTYAVFHEPGHAGFGQIKRAVLLDRE